VASLHQGIADILPTRLSFYENWLDARGLRLGTIGVAPLTAVLSFLRQEGDAYGMITRRAGEYAAEWTVESLSAAQRAAIKASPRWLRKRILLRIARQLVHSSYRDSRPSRSSGRDAPKSICGRPSSARCANRLRSRSAASMLLPCSG
jgi:hypothetical protein